jgi:hypothetical protein
MSKQIYAALVLAGCGLAMAAHADTAVGENTTIGGKGFIDLTSLDQKAAGVKTAASGFGLDVTRFYLVANHTFDSIWSANLTTDFNYVSADSETQLFVKKAYLQAGAGIVADSVPALEHDECLKKLAAIERAIELAEARL